MLRFVRLSAPRWHVARSLTQSLTAGRERLGRESRRIVGFHSAENTWRTFEELYVSDAPYQRYLDSRR